MTALANLMALMANLATRTECAEKSVSPFEGAQVVGFVELLPEPVLGMDYALGRA